MKTLHLHILRQVVGTLMMTAAVFAFILLLGNVLKEILALLVSRQASLPFVLKAVALLVPFTMSYVLPFGMLAAALLVFGRFSADNELTAARAGGISLAALVPPVLVLSLLLSGLCALFNMKVGPECRVAYKRLLMQAGAANMDSLIPEDRFIDEIKGMVLYVRKRTGQDLEDVKLYRLESGQIVQRTRATKGKVLWDKAANTVAFTLFDAITETRASSAAAPAPKSAPEADASSAVEEWVTFQAGEMTTDPVDLRSFAQADLKPRLSEMTSRQLGREISDREKQGIDTTPAQVQLHKQAAFSFASFAFTLAGIPLAIRAHRRETTIGMAVALGMVVVYYSFFILAEALQQHTSWMPQLIFWIPNFLFQAVGGVLLWRANRR